MPSAWRPACLHSAARRLTPRPTLPISPQTRPSSQPSSNCSPCPFSCPPAGLVTLVFVILVAVNFRMILENMLKYGLRFNPLTFLRTALTPSGAPATAAVPRRRRQPASPAECALHQAAEIAGCSAQPPPTHSAPSPRCPPPPSAPAGNLPLLLCWPLLLLFALAAHGIERFGVRLLAMEQRALAASRKRDTGYHEMRRAAARRASATGAQGAGAPGNTLCGPLEERRLDRCAACRGVLVAAAPSCRHFSPCFLPLGQCPQSTCCSC